MKSKCEEIIVILQKEIKLWGQYVEEFTKMYVCLNSDEREELSKIAGVKFKYNFLCQVLEHSIREFDSASEADKMKILNWCFVLLVFENFEFDYRENILRLESLFTITKNYKDLQSLVWTENVIFASNKAISYLKTITNSPDMHSKGNKG